MPNLYKSSPDTREQLFAIMPGLEFTEALFEGVHDQIFSIKNEHHQYVSVNRAFVDRTRVDSKQAVLGRRAAEIFPPLVAAAHEQLDRTVFSTGRAFLDKLEMFTNADGRTGWYLTRKLPVCTSGRVVAVIGVSADLKSPAADDPRLAGLAVAVDRIRRDYREPLRIESLAKDAGLSLSQFERKMRSILRVSPRELLTQTRVEAAAKALRESRSALNRIAEESGFYDQPQFSRQFRQATGLTPGQYRQCAQGG